MHIHILGICGTFMGGIALLARQLGFKVTGSDANVYPPMSTQLEEQGITLMEGYKAAHLKPEPDLVVIGNALSRGNEAVEHILNTGLGYTSGPAFLSDHVLQNKWVLAVAGTHGKTTTSSMLSWVLEYAKLNPGFLIGGVSQNFGVSARLGKDPFFVVEADEYDSAFFDKRSKFVHYRPRTLVINNIEFDHADIFSNLGEIKKQFHHLVRTVPGDGLIIRPQSDSNAQDVLDMGCWTPAETFGETITSRTNQANWHLLNQADDSSHFDIYKNNTLAATVKWPLIGKHNALNGLAAIAAAHHAGVPVEIAADALSSFKNVKRRMEVRAKINDITVYDDFAHHPTAIQTTLAGLRNHIGDQRIIAILEPRSNTMRMGIHKDALVNSLQAADDIVLYQPQNLDWKLSDLVANHAANQATNQATQESAPIHIFDNVQGIIDHVMETVNSDDHVLIMSNGAFDGIHDKLIEQLKNRTGNQ